MSLFVCGLGKKKKNLRNNTLRFACVKINYFFKFELYFIIIQVPILSLELLLISSRVEFPEIIYEKWPNQFHSSFMDDSVFLHTSSVIY